MSYSIFFSPNKQLEIYRSRFELVFAQQKASINKKFYDKFETKQKYIEKFRKSPFKLDSPETSVLYQQKMELLIEKALSMQLKEYEKEIGNTETTISKMEQEIKDLGRCINNETFQGKCDFLLSVYEDNLKEKLQELEKKNKNRILEHQAFQKQKFEQNIENIKNVINIEGLPREEEENLIFLFEEQFNFRLNAFSQKQEIFWSGKKQEIDQKIRRFYETKKLELKKELDRILVNEMDLWEEEKRDKLMNLEKMINSESNPKDFQSLDLEIQNLDQIKKSLLFYKSEKNILLEQIKEKKEELHEASKTKEKTSQTIYRKYQELEKKQKNKEDSLINLKKLIKEKNEILESLKEKNEEESNIYFSSNNNTILETSLTEQLVTGKFREKTTNSKESHLKIDRIYETHTNEDEIIEFSSNSDDEIDFNISSDEN